jgi:hypothetical protein
VKCGSTRIKLANDDSFQDLFIFKIGDRVRAKMSKTVGLVVVGDCYEWMERPDQIFCRISLADGTIWTFRQEDIDPMPEEKAS